MRILVFGPPAYPKEIGTRQTNLILNHLWAACQAAGDKEFVIVSILTTMYDADTKKHAPAGPGYWAARWAYFYRKHGVGLYAKSIGKVDGWEPTDEENWHISSVGGWKAFGGNRAPFERNRQALVEGRPSHAIAFLYGYTREVELMYKVLDKQRELAPDLPRIKRRVITTDKEISWPFNWDN